MTAFDLHLLPGYFGDADSRLLLRLRAGAAGLRLVDLAPTGGGDGVEAGLSWMSSSRAGDLRVAGARLSFTSGPAFGGAITVRGVRPDRRLVALSIETTEVRNPADLELALMGLACGALATEAQGAVLIGSDLGMPGGAGVEGTIAEQVRAAIDRHASHLALIIATADTAQSLGDLPSYHRAPLANLVEYRRTDA